MAVNLTTDRQTKHSLSVFLTEETNQAKSEGSQGGLHITNFTNATLLIITDMNNWIGQKTLG